jgi:hypothetical protein
VAHASTNRYPATGTLIHPREILGVSISATNAEIEAAFCWLASRESPSKGGYADRVLRLSKARDALLSFDDGL